MKIKIELFKQLERIPYPSAEFESMAKAREVAFAEGKRRGADAIVIASIDSRLVRERWTRDGERWTRFQRKEEKLVDPIRNMAERSEVLERLLAEAKREDAKTSPTLRRKTE
jgi:hypothetical protein